MKIAVYSQKTNENEHVGWFRGGKSISYYPNGIKKVINQLFSSLFYFRAQVVRKVCIPCHLLMISNTQMIQFSLHIAILIRLQC